MGEKLEKIYRYVVFSEVFHINNLLHYCLYINWTIICLFIVAANISAVVNQSTGDNSSVSVVCLNNMDKKDCHSDDKEDDDSIP